MIPKQKHEARSKGLSCPAEALADSPRLWADGPWSPYGRSMTHGRLSVKHEQNDPTGTSTRGWSTSNSCRADSLRRPGGRSAKYPPVKSNWPTGSKPKRSRTRDEHEEHPNELLHVDSSRAPRRLSARHGNSSPNLKSKPPKLLLFHGSPKPLKLLRKDLGKM
jgi:hypothetical protein